MCFKQLVGVSCLRMLKTLGIQPSTGLLGDKHCSHYIIQPTMNHLSPCSLAWYLIVWSIWFIWSTFVEFVILGVTSLSWPAAIYSILNVSILPNHRGFVLLGETVVCNICQTFFFSTSFLLSQKTFQGDTAENQALRAANQSQISNYVKIKPNQHNIYLHLWFFKLCASMQLFWCVIGPPGFNWSA